MTVERFIDLLNILIKNPFLVRELNKNSLITEFGEIEVSKNIASIKLYNKVKVYIDIPNDNLNKVYTLFDNVIERVKEASETILEEKIRLCYESISNNLDSSGNN